MVSISDKQGSGCMAGPATDTSPGAACWPGPKLCPRGESMAKQSVHTRGWHPKCGCQEPGGRSATAAAQGEAA